MRFLAALLASAMAASPAVAAIGVPANIGQNSSASTLTSIPVAVGSAVSVGDTILLTGALPSSSAWSALDSQGNTYHLVASNCVWNTSHHLLMFWANVGTAIAAPRTATGSITTTTVTFTTNPGTLLVNQVLSGTGVTANTKITGGISQWNGVSASATVDNSQTVAAETITVSDAIVVSWTTGGKPAWAAVSVSGLAASPLDITGACTSGNGTNATIATGTLAQASEIVLGVEATSGTQAIGTVASGFTALTGAGIGSNNDELHWAYQTTSATTTVTYNQSWTTTRQFVGNVWTFKAPSAATPAPGLLTLGVGND